MSRNHPYPQLPAEMYLDDGQNIAVRKNVITTFPLHWHDYFEIELITGGEGTHILGGKQYELSKGSAYFLRPIDFHEIVSDSSVTLYNIIFRDHVISEELFLRLANTDSGAVKKFEGKEYDALVLAIELLINELERGGNSSSLLLSYIASFFADSKKQAASSERISGINRALMYLELHFRERLSLSDVAREAGFHPTYFSELFKEMIGETYTEALTRLRLEYACVLLSNGCSVSYACFESGFGSLSNFFISFKKKYGMSPKEYMSKK